MSDTTASKPSAEPPEPLELDSAQAAGLAASSPLSSPEEVVTSAPQTGPAPESASPASGTDAAAATSDAVPDTTVAPISASGATAAPVSLTGAGPAAAETPAAPVAAETPAAPVAAETPAAPTPAAAQTPAPSPVTAPTDTAALIQQQQAERDRMLGTVRNTQPDELPQAKPAKPANDRFLGSVGLLLIRLVSALVVGVYGFQLLVDRQPVIRDLQLWNVPAADVWSWVVAAVLLVLSVTLLFGFLTRASGFVLALLAILTLVFLRWGAFNPFQEGQLGFTGQLELLLAGIGLLLVFLGSGGWAIDGGIRASKRRKAEMA